MTINVQQLNNNPFVVGQIGGTYNLGVSIGDIEELYELLGYAESQDMASQIIGTLGINTLMQTPEIIKSVKYRDDVRAAYRIATNVTDNTVEQFNLSNRFEDLLIEETKAYNKAQDGKNWFTRLFSKVQRDGSDANGTILKKGPKGLTAATPSATPTPIDTKSITNMATNGEIHQALGITKKANEVNINITNFNVATKGSPLDAKKITTNMETVTQELGKLANKSSEVYENIDTNEIKKLSDLNKLKEIKQKKKTLSAIDQAAKTSVSNIKSVSKSMLKETLSPANMLLSAGTSLIAELPSIITTFKEDSNEGWKQLGKTLGTILISDVALASAGQIICGTIGFALGGLIGPVGASIGGALGKMVGDTVGTVFGYKLSSWIFGKSASEEQALKQQAQTAASSQVNLQSLLTQAKTQAAQETDAKKAQQILAKVQSIENKLGTSTLSLQSSTTTNPFVTI